MCKGQEDGDESLVVSEVGQSDTFVMREEILIRLTYLGRRCGVANKIMAKMM